MSKNKANRARSNAFFISAETAASFGAKSKNISEFIRVHVEEGQEIRVGYLYPIIEEVEANMTASDESLSNNIAAITSSGITSENSS